MHSCIHCVDDKSKNRWHNVRLQLLQLAICIFLVATAPFVLPAIFGDGVLAIREIAMPNGSAAQESFDGVVRSTRETGRRFDEFRQIEIVTQNIEIEVTNGSDAGFTFETQRTVDISNPGQFFSQGDKVIVDKNQTSGEEKYFLMDKNRLNSLWIIIGIFVIGAILLAGLRGITSLLSLTFSVMVVWYYLVPQILLGANTLLTTFVTVFVITVVSMFLAHGFDKRIIVAVGGTVITLFLSTLFAIFAVQISQLTGAVNEVAFDLQGTKIGANLNLQGLLLAGIIIGAVGVMDDVTTAQAAGVDEISRANPTLGVKQLFLRGISIGQEHAISLVNTLAFAYLGTGLPLILLITAFRSGEWWVILNSEFIAEEVVRTLVGSISLLLAIPITTFMAAAFLRHKKDDKKNQAKSTFAKLKTMSFSEAVNKKTE